MRCTSPVAALFVALALVLPVNAAKKDKVAADKKEAVAQKVAGGTVRAKVVNVEAAKKALTIEFSISYAEPNVGAMANMRNLQVQLATSRDINQRRSLAIQLLQAQAQMATVKQEKHPLDVEAADDIVVRTAILPPKFDDKGKVVPYTAKEKKELKGDDPKLPGYTSDFDSLHPDQIVEVRFAKPKEQPKAKTNTNNKDKDKDADKDAPADNKPVATMIIILAEPPAK